MWLLCLCIRSWTLNEGFKGERDHEMKECLVNNKLIVIWEEFIGALFKADPRIRLKELSKHEKPLSKHCQPSDGDLNSDFFKKRQEMFRFL